MVGMLEQQMQMGCHWADCLAVQMAGCLGIWKVVHWEFHCDWMTALRMAALMRWEFDWAAS